MFKGKKTYAVAVVMVLMGAAGAITGLIPATEAARLIMEGLGFAALRAGVANGPDLALR